MKFALAVLAALTLGAGCPPRPTPLKDAGPAADLAVPVAAPACPATMPLPTASAVCDGLFRTGDGTYYACVKCATDGCMDVTDKMYCVVGSCTSDPACGVPQAVKKPVVLKTKHSGGK